jgi:hypothetical protein
MTPKRPHRLKFIGEVYPDGRAARFIDGIPAEDMDAEATDALTQDQLSVIRRSGLYEEVHAPAPKKSTAKKAAPKAAATQPEAAGADETTDAGDEPTETAETVTQGGES